MNNLIKQIAAFFSVEEEDIKPETNLRELSDDSLEYVEFILMLEDTYKVDIDEDDINHLITVQEVYDYLTNMTDRLGASEKE